MFIKGQVQRTIEASEKNIETLRTVLAMMEKLEPDGWTPDVYRDIVEELYRVRMCVVHRSVIMDLRQAMCQIYYEALPRHRPIDDDDEDVFTQGDFDRTQRALDAALKGLPPK